MNERFTPRGWVRRAPCPTVLPEAKRCGRAAARRRGESSSTPRMAMTPWRAPVVLAHRASNERGEVAPNARASDFSR